MNALVTSSRAPACTVMFLHRFVGFEPLLDAAHMTASVFQELVNHIERCQALGLFQLD